MSGHTPGPWHACRNGECSCKTVLSEHAPVAKIISGKWGDDYPSIRLVGNSLDAKAEAYMAQITYGEINETTAEANARLIAAAPDLLQALEDIIELVAQCTDDDGRPTYEVCQTDDFSSVRAAIAKAKGNDHA